jgi:hypothetical protein
VKLKGVRDKTPTAGTEMPEITDALEEIARLTALVQSLRREVREQRREIAGLREERRALLDADRPQPIATPAPSCTPSECTVPPEWTSLPYYVDPPSGWRYGFPRLYDPAADGDMTEWMIRHGYPERLARQGVVCTFTACDETGER